MISRLNTRALAAAGILGGLSLLTFPGCSERSDSQSARASEASSPSVTFNGKAVLIEVLKDTNSRPWCYPIDLVGAFEVKNYPSKQGTETKIVADLIQADTQKLAYRFELRYGVPPSSYSVESIDMATMKSSSVSSGTGEALLSVELVVNNGSTLPRPKELLAIGASQNAHRFTDLSGKQKILMVIPQ